MLLRLPENLRGGAVLRNLIENLFSRVRDLADASEALAERHHVAAVEPVARRARSPAWLPQTRRLSCAMPIRLAALRARDAQFERSTEVGVKEKAA